MARSASGESVLTRAVRIFEAFTPDETVLSVGQIARRARLHPAALRAALAEVRRQEFAFLPGHVHEDALGVAVPLRDPAGTVIAAVAAIVPVGTPRQAVTGVLTTAARGITRALASPASRPLRR